MKPRTFTLKLKITNKPATTLIINNFKDTIMNKKILTLAISSILFGSTGAWAAGGNNVTVTSTGMSNSVAVDQTKGYTDNITINQVGDRNIANTVQSAVGTSVAPSTNLITIDQGIVGTVANDASATVTQSGVTNKAVVSQLGSTTPVAPNAATVGTTGTVTLNVGSPLVTVVPGVAGALAVPAPYLADINQAGTDNLATINQTDALQSTGTISQTAGASNSNALITQDAASNALVPNTALITQSGASSGSKSGSVATKITQNALGLVTAGKNEGNRAEILQSGANNGDVASTSILQSGVTNLAAIEQSGNDNGGATIAQDGTDNNGGIIQAGNGNGTGAVATSITQNGLTNAAGIDQSGGNNGNVLGTTILQNGDSNAATITESGTNADAQIIQSTSSNIASVDQSNTLVTQQVAITQEGANANEAYVVQGPLSADNVIATVTQTGATNYADIKQ